MAHFVIDGAIRQDATSDQKEDTMLDPGRRFTDNVTSTLMSELDRLIRS